MEKYQQGGGRRTAAFAISARADESRQGSPGGCVIYVPMR